MRFLKRVLICVLVYAAIYLPFVVIMQAWSGGDYTAAYTVGGALASAELILCALIKREEAKQERKKQELDEVVRKYEEYIKILESKLKKEKQNELGRNDPLDNTNSGISGGDNNGGGITHQGVA